MHVSARHVILAPISSSPTSSFRARAWTFGSRGKLCVRAYAAAAARTPVCRMPPPKSFRNQRALAMYSLLPTRHVPIGAPDSTSQHNFSRRDWGISLLPKPLLKHKLTESKGAQRTSIGVAVSAATCHMRAPSRCILRPWECTKSAMATISS